MPGSLDLHQSHSNGVFYSRLSSAHEVHRKQYYIGFLAQRLRLPEPKEHVDGGVNRKSPATAVGEIGPNRIANLPIRDSPEDPDTRTLIQINMSFL